MPQDAPILPFFYRDSNHQYLVPPDLQAAVAAVSSLSHVFALENREKNVAVAQLQAPGSNCGVLNGMKPSCSQHIKYNQTKQTI